MHVWLLNNTYGNLQHRDTHVKLDLQPISHVCSLQPRYNNRRVIRHATWTLSPRPGGRGGYCLNNGLSVSQG